MREDTADKAEVHAFRGVMGSISWLAGQTRPDVPLASVSTATDSATTDCGAGLCVKHGGTPSTPAFRLGSQDQTNAIQNMMLLLHLDASLNTGGFVGSQGGYICGDTDQPLLEGRKECSVVSSGLAIIQDEHWDSSSGQHCVHRN